MSNKETSEVILGASVALNPQPKASSFWDRVLPSFSVSASSWFGGNANKANSANAAKDLAPKVLVPTPVVSEPVAVQTVNAVEKPAKATEHSISLATNTKPEQKPKKEYVPVYKGWTKLQSKTSKNVHTIKDYKVMEEDDFCVLDVSEKELEKNRQVYKAEQDYLKKYASIEHLSHVLPYTNMENGSIVEVLEEDGNKAQYECRRLESDHKGIVGYVLLPKMANAEGRYEVKVLFRGTDPTDIQSAKRNAESEGGAGSISFETHSLSLLKQVNQHIKDFSKNPALNQKGLGLGVYGHSLGGADAQNFTTKVLQAIAEQQGIVTNAAIISKEHVNQFSLIKKLKLNTANSAGVPKVTALHANDLVEKLAVKRPTNVNAVGGFEIPESYNIRVGGDAVQVTGQAHILNDVDPSHCVVDVLKAHIGFEHHNKFTLSTAAATLAAGFALNGLTGGISGALSSAAVIYNVGAGIKDTLQSHTQKLFNAPRVATFERLSNVTRKGQKEKRIVKELSKKSDPLNRLQSAVNFVGRGFSSLGFGLSAVQAAFEAEVRSNAERILKPALAAVSTGQNIKTDNTTSLLFFSNDEEVAALDDTENSAKINNFAQADDLVADVRKAMSSNINRL